MNSPTPNPNLVSLFPERLQPYAKAVVALLLAFLGALAVAWPEGVTSGEWIAIAITTLGTGGGTFAVENRE